MTFKRWLPTFLAFPIGGLRDDAVRGRRPSSPLKAALAG